MAVMHYVCKLPIKSIEEEEEGTEPRNTKTMAEKEQSKFTVPAYAVSEGKPGKKMPLPLRLSQVNNASSSSAVGVARSCVLGTWLWKKHRNEGVE